MSKKNRYLKIYINGDLYRTTGACSRQFRETLYHYGVVATRYGMGYKYKNYNPYIRGVLQSKFRDAAYINSVGYIEDELIGKNKDKENIILHNTWYKSSEGYILSNIENTVKSLHRIIIDCPKGKVIDHINNNRMDNREENLRSMSDADDYYLTSSLFCVRLLCPFHIYC